MTTILYHKGRVYADSTVIKGSERLDCLTKIQGFEMPFRIFSDREGYVFDDVVHGYTGTGSQPGMTGFTNMLKVDQDNHQSVHGVIGHFRMAFEGGLCVHGNTFEAFLIGEKANHSFRFDGDGFNYTLYEKDKIVAMGSGSQEVMAHIQYHGDGVRAMLEAFVTDPNSGGWIDCWSMDEEDRVFEGETKKRWIFKRVGMREPIPKDLIRHVLQMKFADPNKDEVPLQFVRAKTWTDAYTALLFQNEELKKKIERLQNQNARLRGKPVQKKTRSTKQ
jgi:hypothetical protein